VPGEEGELTDEALLTRSAAGDAAAFDLLVGRHAASVLRMIRYRVDDAAAAEDVLQQTFLAAWRSAPRFRGEAQVKTWLFTIARHAAAKSRDRARRSPVTDVPLDALGIEAGWGSEDPESIALASERHDLLRAAFAALDADAREVLTLRDLEGLSGDDTAALLGLSLAAMKSRLHRARMTLAARMKGEVRRATRRA
jgi:RNA polymerase sigma-70 factor (ECF subfamily)